VKNQHEILSSHSSIYSKPEGAKNSAASSRYIVASDPPSK